MANPRRSQVIQTPSIPTPITRVMARQGIPGLQSPTVHDTLSAVGWALAGAAVATYTEIKVGGSGGGTVLTSLLGGSLSAVVAATSPIGSIPEEVGIGAAIASAVLLTLQITGYVNNTPTQPVAVVNASNLHD